MRYEIRYDKPGRLRLRCGRNAFSPEQGYGIEDRLCSDASILSVESSSINGGLLINYKIGHRKHVLSLVKDLGNSKLPTARPKAVHIAHAKQDAFVKATAIEAGKTVLSAIVPTPIKAVLRAVEGIAGWKMQYDSIMTNTLRAYEAENAAALASASSSGYTLASSVISINIDHVPDSVLGRKFKNAVAEVFTPEQDELAAAKQDIPSPARAVKAVFGGRGRGSCSGNCRTCISPCK